MTRWKAIADIIIVLCITVPLVSLLGLGVVWVVRPAFHGHELSRQQKARLIALTAISSDDDAEAATGCRIYDALASEDKELLWLVESRCQRILRGW